jgi:DNA-directed RNA polymerase subunit RPC12/RpoP
MASETNKESRPAKSCSQCGSLAIHKIRHALNQDLEGKYKCSKCKTIFTTPVIKNVLRSKEGCSPTFIEIMRRKQAKRLAKEQEVR